MDNEKTLNTDAAAPWTFKMTATSQRNQCLFLALVLLRRMLRQTLLTVLSLCLTVFGLNFTNPVIYEDFADNDVFLGPDNVYYLSASSMHLSPGAPILQSYDLVNWQLIGYSVPWLDFGSNYNLTDGTNAYNGGIWASTLRYRESNGLWYWIGCVNFWVTYIYTAPAVTGPWSQAASFPGGTCFYDCGLLIDDDDTMYVAYGSDNVSVAQLAADGLSIASTQQVFSYPSECTGIEGNRMYKINGSYYILDDCPSQGYTIIWKADSPFGPYTGQPFVESVPAPVPDGGTPDQGSLVQTPNGDWYFMSFTWAYPLGRMPILAPITWNSDGYPTLDTVNGAWGTSYPYPLPEYPMPSWTGIDYFEGTELSPMWEWNHNPNPSQYIVNNGLTLYTATVTDDLFEAQNSLTRRPDGPYPVGTVEIDFTNMANGDICGLSAFRDIAGWIGVVRNGSSYTLQTVLGMSQNSSDSWATVSTGYVSASQAVSVGKIWLRLSMDARANGDNLAKFYFSTDGSSFQQLGGTLTLDNTFYYFIGYRYAIFNFATLSLGGSIKVISFDSEDSSTGAPTNTVTLPSSTSTSTTSSNSASTTTTTHPPTSTSTTTTRAATTATTTTSSSSSGATQSEWGQCGGIGWTGPTVCAAPYTCQVGNPWYSQCLSG
jgi:beta-xylosidase